MPTNTLLVAQLDAEQVVSQSSSGATGTGAFLLDPVQHMLAYSLTYQGLEAGGANSIALYNFGKGKNGEAVGMLCGTGTQPCPNGTSASISGRFENADGSALDNTLIGAERVYVEIVGGNGKPEIRGQLAHLAPAAHGSGTAIVSETYLPNGKISVFYAATVASTSGAPTNAALVGGRAPRARVFRARAALPRLNLRTSRDKEMGGSLSGLYEVSSAAPNAFFAARLLSKNIFRTRRSHPETGSAQYT
jgi:hypothetical protein